MADVRRDDLWRRAAVVLLAPVTLVVVRYRGDGWGGDTAAYLESASDVTAPSRFPPGLPLLIAPFPTAALPWVMTAVTLALVGCIWWAAVKVGGWRSGAVAAALMLMSPWLILGGGVVMADRLGALTTVGALLAVLYRRPVLAGLLAGVSSVVRLAHAAFVVALPRRSWLPAGAVVGALLAFQLLVRGSLLGYSSGEASWAISHLWGDGVWFEQVGVAPAEHPNWWFFPAVLAGWGGLIPTGGVLLAAVGLWRHRGPGGRFSAVTVALNLAIYLPYYFQSTRFMAPATCLLIVYAAAAIGSRSRNRDDDHETVGAGATRTSRLSAAGAVAVSAG